MAKKMIVTIVIVLLGIEYICADEFYVNDNNVRVRESYSTKSRILGILKVNDPVNVLSAGDGETTEEYKWVKIKFQNGVGWVFGEYIGIQGQKGIVVPGRLYNNLEARVNYKGYELFIGMKESDLFNKIGLPKIKIFDSEYNEWTYKYMGDNSFLVIVNGVSKRITQIIINRMDVKLKSGVSVGDNFDAIRKKSSLTDFLINGSVISCNLWNGYYSDFYQTAVIINVEKNNIVTSIQIGNPATE